MFRCERCGSSYNPLRSAGIENCPRCLMRDRIESPLAFKAFELPASIAERAGRVAAKAPYGERLPLRSKNSSPEGAATRSG